MGVLDKKGYRTIETTWPLGSYRHYLWSLACALVETSSLNDPAMTMAPLHSILYFETQLVDDSLGQRPTTGAGRGTTEEEGQCQQTPWLAYPLLCSLKCNPWVGNISIT